MHTMSKHIAQPIETEDVTELVPHKVDQTVEVGANGVVYRYSHVVEEAAEAVTDDEEDEDEVGTDAIANGDSTNDEGVQRHFAYFRWAYDQANQSWYVQKAKDTYDAAKRSSPMLANTLEGIESRVADASQYAPPLYADYVYPTTDRLANAYVRGMESTKNVRHSTMAVAARGGTVGLNLMVLSTQLSLITNAALTSVLLDGMILMKKAGARAFAGGVSLEKALEHRLHGAIEASRGFAKNPVGKFNEHANGFLDIANDLVDNHLQTPVDKKAERTTKGASERSPKDANVPERISCLARRLLDLLQTRTHDDILKPAQNQLSGLSEQLNKCLALVGQLKTRRGELSDKVHEAWSKLSRDGLSETAADLRTRIETEARDYKITPEEALLRSVHRCSNVLNSYITQLRDKSEEVVPAAALSRFDGLAAYVEQLDSNLGKAKNVDEVRNEVLDEAKHKLDELTQWANSFRLSQEEEASA